MAMMAVQVGKLRDSTGQMVLFAKKYLAIE
jgi:hypothetical protein